MNDRELRFMEGVLGANGARALFKAAERSAALKGALMPRTILAWLDLATRYQYEGELPGVENTYFTFKKNEAQGFDGAVSIGEDVFSFEKATVYHVAGSIAAALGSEPGAVDGVKDLDLARLGRSIDLLAKAQVVAAELEKRVLDPALGYSLRHENTGGMTKIHAYSHDGSHVGTAVFEHAPEGHLTPGYVVVNPEHQRKGLASAMYGHAQKLTGKVVKPSDIQSEHAEALWAGNAKQPQFGAQKAELPGQAAKPKKQLEPLAPIAPDPTQDAPKAPPKSKLPSLKVVKSQAKRPCRICSKPQFNGVQYVGCVCFRAMAKSVKTTVKPDGFLLEFGSDWDLEGIEALMTAVQGP